MPNELPPKSNLVVVRNAQYRERYISPEQGYPIEPQVPKKPPLWFTILFQVLLIVFLNFAIPKTISLMFDFSILGRAMNKLELVTLKALSLCVSLGPQNGSIK